MHRTTLKQVTLSLAALSLIAGAGAFRSADRVETRLMAADSTDPEVVSFLVQANQDEIRAARGILSTTRNPEVRSFAQRMVNDHGQALTKVQAIGKRLGYAISDSTPSRPDMTVPSNDSMAHHGDSLHAMPMPMPSDSNSVSSRPFPHTDDSTGVNAGPHGADHAYVDAQVAAHQQVLDKLQATAPGIKDAELKKFVTDVQKTVKSHLTEAKRLEGVLRKTST
jgi:predicted outer membrane protein